MESPSADARHNPPRYLGSTPLRAKTSTRRNTVSEVRGSAALSKIVSSEIGTTEGLFSSISRISRKEPADPADGSRALDELALEKGAEGEAWLSDDEWYPDGGWRAWKVILGCFIFASCQLGYGMVWGVIVVAMRDTALFKDVPLSILNLVIGLNNVTCLGLSFFTGRLGERFGYKRMILLGTVLMYIFFVLSATAVHSLVASFFFQGLFIGFSIAIGMPLYMALPAQWFKRRRGIATGIVISGTGFGGAISNLIVRGLVPRVGYHHAVLIWGSINFFMSIIAWFLLEVRTRPVKPGSPPESGSWLPEGMLRDVVFHLLLLALFLGNFGFLSPLYFLTAFTKLHCPQLDPNSLLPAIPLVVATGFSGFGRIGAGFLADRIGPVNAFILTWLLGGTLQVVFWPLAKTYGTILAFAALYGLTGTSFLSLLPVCCAQLFGVEGLATITGACVMSTAPGQFVGSTIAGVLLTKAGGNYAPVAYYSGAMMLAAAGSSIAAKVIRAPSLFSKF